MHHRFTTDTYFLCTALKAHLDDGGVLRDIGILVLIR